MKLIPLQCLIILIIVVAYGCKKKEYYSFSSGEIFSIEEVQEGFSQAAIGLPSGMVLKPVIFHKDTLSDSVINFIAFEVKQGSSPNDSSIFKPTYIQDSLYLLLNKKMPDFTMKDINGRTFYSSSMMGRPWLLNFWAIYCPPCVREIPELNKLKSKYGEQFGFVAVTENTCEEGELTNFLDSHPFDFQILENGEALKHSLKISDLPKNFFIDHEGIVRHIVGNYPISTNRSGEEIETPFDNYFVDWIEELIIEN